MIVIILNNYKSQLVFGYVGKIQSPADGNLCSSHLTLLELYQLSLLFRGGNVTRALVLSKPKLQVLPSSIGSWSVKSDVVSLSLLTKNMASQYVLYYVVIQIVFLSSANHKYPPCHEGRAHFTGAAPNSFFSSLGSVVVFRKSSCFRSLKFKIRCFFKT